MCACVYYDDDVLAQRLCSMKSRSEIHIRKKKREKKCLEHCFVSAFDLKLLLFLYNREKDILVHAQKNDK